MGAEPVNHDDLTDLVAAAIKVNGTGNLHHYLEWNFRHLLNELHPGDVTDDELMALNALLAQAVSRKLALAEAGIMLRDPLIRRGGAGDGRVPGALSKTALRVVVPSD